MGHYYHPPPVDEKFKAQEDEVTGSEVAFRIPDAHWQKKLQIYIYRLVLKGFLQHSADLGPVLEPPQGGLKVLSRTESLEFWALSDNNSNSLGKFNGEHTRNNPR